MANYLTYIGETQILLEAPVGNALSKSESEVKADPYKAIENVFDTIAKLATYAGQTIGPAVRGTGGAFEMSFAVRADTSGLVMVAEDAKAGQFQCTLKWPPMRPAGPPRPGPPALPQKGQG